MITKSDTAKSDTTMFKSDNKGHHHRARQLLVDPQHFQQHADRAPFAIRPDHRVPVLVQNRLRPDLLVQFDPAFKPFSTDKAETMNTRHGHVEHRTQPFQCNLYQECSFLCLISVESPGVDQRGGGRQSQSARSRCRLGGGKRREREGGGRSRDAL
eukprot:3821985-Rhodomonas_salina.1